MIYDGHKNGLKLNQPVLKDPHFMGGTRIFGGGGERGGKAEGMGATENRHCRTLNRVKPSYANRE